MDKNIQDLIDNYMFGRMTAEQQRTFEHELSVNQELRQQFQFTSSVQREIADRNAKQKMMQSWKTPKKHLFWPYWAAAASVVLVVAIGVLIAPSNLMPSKHVYSQAVMQKPQPSYVASQGYSSSHELLENQSDEVKHLIEKVSSQQSSSGYTTASYSTSSVSSDDYAQQKADGYMREVEYYQKQAANYRREAEYYKKQAENYEREQQYRLKQAEKYQREAADYSKRGDYDRAKTQTRYAQSEIDKAKTQASYAKSAWDKYKTQMNYAKNADEKAATNLRYAREALR